MGALATWGMQSDAFTDPDHGAGTGKRPRELQGRIRHRVLFASAQWCDVLANFRSLVRQLPPQDPGLARPREPMPIVVSTCRAASQRACEVSSSCVLSVFRPSSYIYFNPTSVSFRFSSHLSNYSALRFQPPKVIAVGGALQFRRLSVVPTSTSIFFSHFI
jgi:hypothetical protein